MTIISKRPRSFFNNLSFIKGIYPLVGRRVRILQDAEYFFYPERSGLLKKIYDKIKPGSLNPVLNEINVIMKASLASRLAVTLCIAAGFSLCSCKKENSSASTATSNESLSAAGDDQAQVSDESDAITDDALTGLEGQANFSGADNSSVSLYGNTPVDQAVTTQGTGQFAVHGLICDATVTYDTSNNQRIITIVYNGSNCRGNRTRTGTVIITLPYPHRWKDAGATATISIQQLKITRLRDGKSIVINGSKTFTNVSGGLLKNLATLGSITHTVTSDSLSITFDNGKQRGWHVAKQRVFTYNNGIVMTTTGTHSDGTDSQIAEWGTNRFGNAFKSLISAPKVFRQDCDFRLTAGQNTVKTDLGVSVITYGLDADGNPTGCPGTGNYYLKLVWTGVNGGTYTVIMPY
jgi:hypothetical protein